MVCAVLNSKGKVNKIKIQQKVPNKVQRVNVFLGKAKRR